MVHKYEKNFNLITNKEKYLNKAMSSFKLKLVFAFYFFNDSTQDWQESVRVQIARWHYGWEHKLVKSFRK